MIYYLDQLCPWLHQLTSSGSIAFRGVIACALAFALTLAFGPRIIRALISLKVGQPIRSAEEVHKLAELHGAKAGTPTMGGLMIIGSSVVATVLLAPLDNPFILVCLAVMLAHCGLGFADDYLKVKKKNAAGVAGRVKLMVQGIVALAAMCLLVFYPETGMDRLSISDFICQAHVPFVGTFDLGLLMIPFGVLVLVGTSNAVNLTDGLDGLASGCSITTFFAYSLIAYMVGDALMATEFLNIPTHPMVGELSVFTLSLVGACMGFLWFNCFPARVFMGDTGSLALGAALGMVALCTAQQFLLVIIGAVFVMEAGSVVLQVASFKSRGKRIFLMSPIHHHFELKGWKETQVITRFWMISLIAALIGVCLLKVN